MAAEDREEHDLSRHDLNRDPITDEPGAHPVGTGVGAAGGALAGAAAGTIGGPVGTLVGGVIGAVVGGLAGKAAAEAANPTAEEAHWRENYTDEPYYEAGRSFDDYGPAYMHGVRGRMNSDIDWDAAEPMLASEWDDARAGSGLAWEQARPASRAAWDRLDAMRGPAGDAATVRSADLAGGRSSGLAPTRDDALVGASIGRPATDRDTAFDPDSTGLGLGAAGMLGAAQSAGNTSGDTGDVIDALQDLVECCKDGEYGFRTSAGQAGSADLKSLLLRRADDCHRSAAELNQQIRALGGKAEDSGSALGAVHRGWVAVRATLSTYDDRAVLEECERGEDNAVARYRKALKQPMPAAVQAIVERQAQGAQRNHDEIRRLRDQSRQ